MISSQVGKALRPPSLWREITVVLACKLLALLALYYLFFDERPHTTPDSVQHPVSDDPAPAEAPHD